MKYDKISDMCRSSMLWAHLFSPTIALFTAIQSFQNKNKWMILFFNCAVRVRALSHTLSPARRSSAFGNLQFGLEKTILIEER